MAFDVKPVRPKVGFMAELVVLEGSDIVVIVDCLMRRAATNSQCHARTDKFLEERIKR